MEKLYEKLNELESNKSWYETYSIYDNNYKSGIDYDFILRYSFFCWYMISQWEQIDFKENLTIRQRITLDTIDGLSKSELYNKVNLLVHKITKDFFNKDMYVNDAILSHMVITFSYVFNELQLDEYFYRNELKNIYIKSNNPIAKYLYYKSIEKEYSLDDNEKKVINSYFLDKGLMGDYFMWYLL